uniref:Uncharacterized protein n=1 Tax=Mycoplasma suis TaxID=57372 RepID=Q8KM84_9MOLU|nr:hypothetical protein [Mycoplasma suis]
MKHQFALRTVPTYWFLPSLSASKFQIWRTPDLGDPLLSPCLSEPASWSIWNCHCSSSKLRS